MHHSNGLYKRGFTWQIYINDPGDRQFTASWHVRNYPNRDKIDLT